MAPLPPHPAVAAIGLIAAFALGAIPFGVIWSLVIAGVDPRTAGSKNIGFTNVLRVSSRWAAGLTLISDVGKGAAAVWIVRHLNGGSYPAWDSAAVLSAVTGHMFSPVLRFQGGKGVATALGGLLVAMPWVGLIILAVWGLVLAVSSYVSLASIVASLVLPVTMALFTSNWIAISCGTMLTVLVIVRHSENIKRLQAGVEHSIRGSKPPKTA
ncbi:MAG TPA: glycerol-3-phosphate 1-O-acyltransferase PlsY [Nitrospiria bacterium]|nr:glycerol-3-phosphate 1-O-acyltransferase PlsY [Nitrospiria bacterium]